MKQNISVEQLNELSDKVKAKFILDYNIKRWKAENKMMKNIFGTKTNDPTLKDFLEEERFHDPTHTNKLPLLSIGQMIEFLYDNVKDWDLSTNLTIQLWHDKAYSVNYEQGMAIEKKELADALWEACKEILNG